MAILLLEEASRHELRPNIQIFGSDLDSRALASAREGRFPAAIEADVSEESLRRFFVREGDHYRVRQEVRGLVLFAIHDLLKDPPFSHIDFISCRNVLIYLDRDLQEQVCTTFHYALNPAGYLLLGSSETADHPPGLFRTIDRSARLYQSAAQVGEKPRLLGPVRVREHVIPLARTVSPTVALGEAALHRHAIEQVAPPSILVDETHRVIHLSDNAGRYLMPSGGPLSGDVADLARPEFRFELRSSLNRVFELNQPVLSLPIPVHFNGAAHRVHLLVKPAREAGSPRYALVMFIEGDAIDGAAVGSSSQSNDETVAEGSWSGELKQKTKDGRTLVVESRIQLEALDGRRLVLESTRDVTERKLWQKRQTLLLSELAHRVKNTLSVVQSIAHQTLRSSSSADDFKRFGGRLLALGTAHTLLVQSDWQGAIWPLWRELSLSLTSRTMPSASTSRANRSCCRPILPRLSPSCCTSLQRMRRNTGLLTSLKAR